MTETAGAMHLPQVISLDSIVPILVGEGPATIRVSRLVTRELNGSGVLFGVVWMDPGAASEWSFEPQDQHLDGVRYWGPVDETYFVLTGRIRVTWNGGAFEAGQNQAVHFAPGFRYRCESIGTVAAFIVYALAPAPF